ncbi:MAG: xanthine dehydrogenase family protein subunit M [Dehalococcoidia bacterium]|nr:xanthine dehydrogenase family protein subunit M [Dehalococcoidia bacterium]
MIPESFEYHAPQSLEEAWSLIEGDPEAKILAGGHSLIPLMKLRLASPSATTVGAMTTHADIGANEALVGRATALHQAANLIGDQQVRNRGTIGGSLAHADPAGDYPAVALALGAEIVVKGRGGERVVRADDWFVGMLTTALGAGEIVTEVRFPASTSSAYEKFENPASGYAIVGVAASIKLDGDTASDVRVGVTGAAGTAFRATSVEDALRGQRLTPDVIARASPNAVGTQTMMGDVHASEEYRRHLVSVLTERALNRAWLGG